MGRDVRTSVAESAATDQGTRRKRMNQEAVMVAVAPGIENHTLLITQEIHVRASLAKTFAALLEQIGPLNAAPDGTPMRMKLEAWPGGRWFRDLGDNNGHFWGVVQAIKQPTLLEI